MATPPSWAAVVVSYESGSLLVDCVRSLLADTDATPGGAGVPELVVVDNGSVDGSVTSLRAAFPDVTVVDPGGNLGYATAANRGIAATTAPVVVVSNADLVVAPGTAAAMLARFDAEPDLAAVGPALLNPDGSQYPSARAHASTTDAVGHAVLGRLFPRNRFTRRYRQLDAHWDRPRDVDWVSGAFMFLRRSALDSVGGWDERYFMYMEDFDLCWRLRRLGWRVAYEPGGRVTHVQGASTKTRPYRMIVEHHRSAYRFLARRWRGAQRLLLLPAACFLALRALVDMTARALGTRPETPRVSG
jgi:N-acetylglucosaminyl-diphospho-decaprenol L-rhamnosyltransferase